MIVEYPYLPPPPHFYVHELNNSGSLFKKQPLDKYTGGARWLQTMIGKFIYLARNILGKKYWIMAN